MSKVVLETIDEREKFLQNIIDGNIELMEGGTVINLKDSGIFQEPCNVEKLLYLFGGSMEPLGKGANGIAFKVCFEPDCKNTIVIKQSEMKESPFYVNLENPNRPENVEIGVLKKLNELLIAKATPNIPFYLGDFVCKIENSYYRYFMTERADGDLDSYIRSELFYKENEQAWKSILFQVISVLHIAQKKYPTFKHNDLHGRNVLYFNTEGKGNYKYTIFGVNHIVPDVGIQLALWDFDFASILPDLNNIKSLDFQNLPYGIRSEANTYADMFKFLNALLIYIEKIPFPSLKPKAVMNFIDRIIPKDLQTSDVPGYVGNGGLIYDLNYMSPLEALKDPYFDEYRNVRDPIDIVDRFDDTYATLGQDKILNVPVEIKYDFNCSKIQGRKLLDLDYRSGQGNLNRFECIKSKDEPTLKVSDFSNLAKDNARKWMYQVVEVLIKIVDSFEDYNYLMIFEDNLVENLVTIADIVLRILDVFIEEIYIPISYFELITLICLDKAIFYLVHVHYMNAEIINLLLKQAIGIESKDSIIYDLMIQITKFLDTTGIEARYLAEYEVRTLDGLIL
jgi:hypothetical protein